MTWFLFNHIEFMSAAREICLAALDRLPPVLQYLFSVFSACRDLNAEAQQPVPFRFREDRQTHSIAGPKLSI